MVFKREDRSVKRYVCLILSILTLLTLPELLILHQRLVSHTPAIQQRHDLQASVSNTSGNSVRHIEKQAKISEADASKFKGGNESIFASQALAATRATITNRSALTVSANQSVITTEEPSRRRMTNTSTRLLFPVHFWEGGPNWNYLSFRMLVAYAITHNRSIVMIPFHNHFVKGFTKGYRPFEETFDINRLRKIVPVVTPEFYKEVCGASIDFLVQFPISKMRKAMRKENRKRYERTRGDFKKLWDIYLPDTKRNRRNFTETERQMMKANEIRCLGIYGPRQIPNFLTEKEKAVFQHIDRNFRLSENIRSMGATVKSLLCGGKPYIAIHWRNRTGEMVEYHSIDCKTEEQCLHNLAMLSNASQVIAEAVGQFMKNLGIDCVYVAIPPRRQEFVERLRNIVRHVYTAHFITSRDNAELRRLEDDNYVLSLVEQEVCQGAEVFLRCGVSNWSEFVQIGRESLGKEVAYLRDIQNIPEEIYEFI